MPVDKCSKSCLKFKLQERRLKSQYTDVTLICKDETKFPAHKVLLMNSSPYFEKMFEGSFEEAQSGVGRVDFDSKTLSIILDFVYLEDDAIIELNNMNEVEALLRAAHMLQMEYLFTRCCDKAENIMISQDFTKVHSWNQLYENVDTENLLVKWIKKFSDKALQDELHLEYNVQQLALLVEDWIDKLDDNDDDEKEDKTKRVILTIIKWIKFNRDERKQHTATLVSQVDTKYLSLDFVRKFLLAEEIIRTNCEVMFQLLKSAETWKKMPPVERITTQRQSMHK